MTNAARLTKQTSWNDRNKSSWPDWPKIYENNKARETKRERVWKREIEMKKDWIWEIEVKLKNVKK